MELMKDQSFPGHIPINAILESNWESGEKKDLIRISYLLNKKIKSNKYPKLKLLFAALNDANIVYDSELNEVATSFNEIATIIEESYKNTKGQAVEA
jgi:hypothetical protein